MRGNNITGNLNVDHGVERLAVRYPHICLDCAQTYLVLQSFKEWFDMIGTRINWCFAFLGHVYVTPPLHDRPTQIYIY